MRIQLVTLIILATFIHVSARVSAQRVTVKLESQTLEQAFKAIEARTAYRFWYKKENLTTAKPVTATFKDANIKDVLDALFLDQPLTYTIFENTVNVKAKSVTRIEDIAASISDEPIEGIVLDENGKGLHGVTVTIKGTSIKTVTDEQGKFKINGSATTVLVFSYIGYQTKDLATKGTLRFSVGLELETRELNEIKIGSTGYQYIPKERATGSFDHVDNSLLNRSISQNILDRIENLTPGILFDRSPRAPDPLLIRGRGTIYANAAPLIILNNFPYDGDINNINPNDIESVTVLKDAAAASIWGARAGNGVIVITTKRGKAKVPEIQFTSNIALSSRPDIANVPTIGASDYIDLETWLYGLGYYTSDLNSINHAPITPVVEILEKQRTGSLTAAEATSQINEFRTKDAKSDVKKYLYQNSLNSQYALNVSGNNDFHNYFMSVGYDYNKASLVGNSNNRISIRVQNSFKLSSRLNADLALSFVQRKIDNGGNPGNAISAAGKQLYPYAQLVDDLERPLPINYNFRNNFIESAANQGLLNWQYNPINEIGATRQETNNIDYLINSGLKYTITEWINVEGKYQYENSNLKQETNNSLQSYFTRNLINTFYQPNATNKFPIPKGAIIDRNDKAINSHQARLQLNIQKIIGNSSITAIAGAEVRNIVTTGLSSRLYGYVPETYVTNPNLDYVTSYPQYYNTSASQKILLPNSASKMTDNFVSMYANALYSLKRRYNLSASVRKDEANLFGVSANQKGTPLWSIGGSWEASNESFYAVSWLKLLKLRMTYGHSGNISRLTSAYTTASYSNSFNYQLPSATILNAPNSNLRWERVKMLNIGIDFSSNKDLISGSIEVYKKKAIDLLGQAPIDPTYGLGDGNSGQSFFYGNVATMTGKGIDVQITSKNVDRKFKWSTNYIFSIAESKIVDYMVPLSQLGSTYLSENNINPVKGRPVFSMYSYAWAGLDPNTGDPLGVINKVASKDYRTMLARPLDSLVYGGNVQPTGFGAIRNNFSYGPVSLSFNISFKYGGHLRNTSVNYASLYSSWIGHSDYAKRWMKPGDELTTNVPSRVYANYTQFSQRNTFYTFSEQLIISSDQIRFEDINLSYSLGKRFLDRIKVNQARIYFYANNLGVLWTRNKDGIDPNFINAIKQRPRYSLGVSITF